MYIVLSTPSYTKQNMLLQAPVRLPLVQRLLIMARVPRRVSLANCCFVSCSMSSYATEQHNITVVVCRCSRRGQSRPPHAASCTQAEAAGLFCMSPLCALQCVLAVLTFVAVSWRALRHKCCCRLQQLVTQRQPCRGCCTEQENPHRLAL